MPPPAKPKSGPIQIPVKVVVDRSRPTPVAPARTPAPAKSPVAPPAPRRQQRSLSQAPLEQRRRWMWGIVAVGMFLAVVLWGLSLGAELRQNSNRPNLIADITSLFRSFRLPEQPGDPKQEEIQQLEEQVFPQFQ